MRHDIRQRRGAAIVEVRRVLPGATQRRRPVLLLRGPLRVRRIHTRLGRRVQDVRVDVREGVARIVALRAAGVALEELLAPRGRRRVEAARGRSRRLQTELVLAQRRQLGRDEVRAGVDVDPQPGILEAALPVHLRHRDVRVPVRHRPLPRVRLQTHTVQTVGGREHHRAVDPVDIEARIVKPRLPRRVHRLQGGRKPRREGDDRPDRQIPIGPPIQPVPDARRDRVVDRGMAERARRADPRDLIAHHRPDQAHDGVQTQQRTRRSRVVQQRRIPEHRRQHLRRNRRRVHLQPETQRLHGTHRLDQVVQPQRVRPEPPVAKIVVTEDLPALRDQARIHRSAARRGERERRFHRALRVLHTAGQRDRTHESPERDAAPARTSSRQYHAASPPTGRGCTDVALLTKPRYRGDYYATNVLWRLDPQLIDQPAAEGLRPC